MARTLYKEVGDTTFCRRTSSAMCREQLKQIKIVSSATENTMNVNCSSLDGVEDEVVFNNEVSVVEPGELLFFWNLPQVRML